MPETNPNQKISPQTFQILLKSLGFDHNQISDSLTDIKSILESDLLQSLVSRLSDNDLYILNSLKTQKSIEDFLKKKLPNFDKLVQDKVTKFQDEIVNQIGKIKEDLPPASPSSSAIPASGQPSVQQPELPGLSKLPP
ncbi:MAG TPA: hypothetical protein PKL83_05885, partial [bacterium]|nr:hypothetical protein [bacterium]